MASRAFYQLALLSVLLMSAGSAGAVGPEPALPEYRVKAAFLYHFAKFVEWPARSFEAPDSPIIIAVLGADPFGSELDLAVSGKVINSRPLAVVRYALPEQVAAAHILFISADDAENLPALLQSLHVRPILTVSDSSGFARSGGMVEFFHRDRRVAFAINREAARQAGLKLSSKLLNLAHLVGAAGGE